MPQRSTPVFYRVNRLTGASMISYGLHNNGAGIQEANVWNSPTTSDVGSRNSSRSGAKRWRSHPFGQPIVSGQVALEAGASLWQLIDTHGQNSERPSKSYKS
ncbi:unnamed protein product [Protopolystoma xenopodis]|uniref:Uncharacterized protein n=1 Tax=Protopolystoma xenopodis TaxID=117903 RepID=A0A448XR88_9PLAT|nr:unnamed protein product [Protopolystoma xenopodis]